MVFSEGEDFEAYRARSFAHEDRHQRKVQLKLAVLKVYGVGGGGKDCGVKGGMG